MGRFSRVAQDEEYVLAILDVPENWERFQEHALSGGKGGWVYIPCTTNCPACKRHPENQPRWYAGVPVYVYEYKKVQYYRAPSTVVTSLLNKYKNYKRKGFLDYKWILTRYDGQGPTSYDFDRQMEKVTSKVKSATPPDMNKALADRWQNAMNQLEWNVTGEKFDDDDDEVFDHDDDDSGDVDIDKIKGMKKKELIEFIEEYELDIEDPEEIKTGALRKLVIAEAKEEL